MRRFARAFRFLKANVVEYPILCRDSGGIKEVKMASGRDNSALTSLGIADRSSKELQGSISISSEMHRKRM